MVRKKVEGDEDARRAEAHKAAADREAPSARGVTTGASKQRRHVGAGGPHTHEERVASQHRGKQEWRTGDLAEEGLVDTAAAEPSRDFTGRGSPSYSTQHEQVFRALAQAEGEHDGQAVPLPEVAQAAGFEEEDTRVLLHDLVAVHRLATEIQDSASGLAHYETAARH